MSPKKPKAPIGAIQMAAVALQTETIVLTDAQIKALPSLAVEILPAPGAGKMYRLLAGVMTVNFVAGAYTNVNAENGHGFNITAGSRAAAFTDAAWLFSDVSQPGLIELAPRNMAFEFSPGFSEVNSGGSFLSDYENHPLLVGFENNNQGDFTGGHPDNTLRVTVAYLVLDL